MHDSNSRSPSPALVVAIIALVAALAGSAVALPGKNTVDKNDIQKGAVTKKAFKKSAVTTKAIKDGGVGAVDIAAGVIPDTTIPDGSITGAKLADGAVNSAKIADGSVGAADLTADENFHRVGGSGEPTFGNGGDGDCIWNSTVAPGISLNPVSFYIDKGGRVHLAGLTQGTDGSGGDMNCNDTQDARVYTLPPAYRPENVEFIPLNTVGTGSAIALIIGDEDVVLGPDTLAAGGVFISSSELNQAVTLDGVSFRAAGTGNNGLGRSRSGPAVADLSDLGIELGG